jgi:hypothetical protein
MQYVIKRTDQAGGYVAKPGLKESYTKNIEKVRVFETMEKAQQNRCIENEIVVPIDEI